MNADGKTLEITDVENATSYDVYVDGTLKTNVASAPNTTTVDLSTLSDIADGTHTIKVKAKADGYKDSGFSNEVSYTKAPAGYKLTITGSWFETGLPAGVSGVLSFNGIDPDSSFNFPNFPRYISTGSTESSVDYEATKTSSRVKKACPLVFENISKIAISGYITMNGVNNLYDEGQEYVLTQDTTIALGYKED